MERKWKTKPPEPNEEELSRLWYGLTEYARAALLVLARQDGALNASEIAKQIDGDNNPNRYKKALSELVKAKLVETRKGPGSPGHWAIALGRRVVALKNRNFAGPAH